MLITKAKRENTNEILDLYHSVVGSEFCVWDMEYPNLETINFDIDNDGLYIGLIDNKIMCAISICADLEFVGNLGWEFVDNVLEISRFVVSKEYQSQGFAKMMLEYVLNDLKRLKINSVHLACQYQNIPAKKVYESFNFNVVSEIDMFDNHYLLMEKVVSDL